MSKDIYRAGRNGGVDPNTMYHTAARPPIKAALCCRNVPTVWITATGMSCNRPPASVDASITIMNTPSANRTLINNDIIYQLSC